MNKVMLIGRLTKDPELRYTPGGGKAVATFTLAVDNGNGGADFIPIVVWGRPAENAKQYITKGRQVAISGKISVRSYDAKDGTKRYVTEVVADSFNGIMYLGKKDESASLAGLHSSIAYIDEYSSKDEEPFDEGNMPF